MNDNTLQKLEFDAIREALARCCSTALGKRLARSITPSVRAKLVRRWLDQVRELLAISKELGMPPMAGITDIREHVRAAAFATPLEGDALAQIAETLTATGTLRSWLTRVLESTPSLANLSEQVIDHCPVAAQIDDAIDGRGEVRDHASPKLASIRRAIEEARRQIRVVFQRLLRHPSVTRMLQYQNPTFHSDRMVLPLKAEYRGRVSGIVHRSSDSGATLFVEPAESVELNNTIVRMRDEEGKEITRILRELTQLVCDEAKPILRSLRAIAALDLVAAKCRYGEKRSCICPAIDPDGPLDLHEARHPVLLELFAQEAADGKPPREVVPIDVRLGDDFDVLVVTGPNTGGKTVALKTVGLLVAMAQSGIPIPVAKGSRLPVFRELFIDVGDEQSLQQSLSTFSSHMANLLRILGESGPNSLVLIDELGAGTDPDEGAAIGRTVLCELLALKAKAIVSTHLSSLKAVAYTTDRVDNAAVEFDAQSLKPTYRLRLGEPGNSNALIIAKRLGMSARLVKQAKGFLADRTRALNQAIAGTLQSRREAEEARKTAREAGVQADRAREEFEEKQRELKRSQEEFSRWTEWIQQLKPRDDVYVRPFKRSAKLVRIQLHRQIALVSDGAVDMEVALQDIAEPVNEPE